MAKSIELGNVVRDFYIGNTHILICDDYYRDRTKEEEDAIMENIARLAWESRLLAEECAG